MRPFVLALRRKRGMVTAFPELPAPTDRIGDLTEPERLVVCCFRHWLAGGTQREMLWRRRTHELAPGGEFEPLGNGLLGLLHGKSGRKQRSALPLARGICRWLMCT